MFKLSVSGMKSLKILNHMGSKSAKSNRLRHEWSDVRLSHLLLQWWPISGVMKVKNNK